MKTKLIIFTLLTGVLFFRIKAEPCAVPTWLGARDITHNSVQFVCVSMAGDHKVLQLSVDGVVTGTYDWNSSDPYDVTGLEPGTTYTAEVRAVCSEGDSSAWLAPVEFTTEAEPCAVPTWLGARDITHNSVQFVCVSMAGDHKVLQLSVDGVVTGTYDWNSADPYDVTGLEPGTTYTAEVRAVCSEGDSSAWLAPVEFTTEAEPQPEPVCGVPTGLKSVVEDSSVVLSWSAGEGNVSFLLYYRKSTQDTVDVKASQNSEVELGNLEYNVVYLWSVRGVCEKDSSDLSEELDFILEGMSNTVEPIQNSFLVLPQEQVIHIINRDRLTVDRIQIYETNGSLVVDQRVGSDNNISIPVKGQRMLLVRILTQSSVFTKKVFVL